tara:strand:+ start:173 stop:433 length:261 start_codon:yes stop_codon:yes gene_type:complete
MIRIMFIGIVTVYLTGCVTTIETLDGLCFNEKDGTYMCDKPERKRKEPEDEKEWEEFHDMIDDNSCTDEMKTYHGHCVDSKYRNVA